MISEQQARATLLGMPVVEEGTHYGRPDFRVNGTIFATLYTREGFIQLKVGKDEQRMLSSAGSLYTIPERDKGGWIQARMMTISGAEFDEVVWKAWRHTAGPKLSLQY